MGDRDPVMMHARRQAPVRVTAAVFAMAIAVGALMLCSNDHVQAQVEHSESRACLQRVAQTGVTPTTINDQIADRLAKDLIACAWTLLSEKFTPEERRRLGHLRVETQPEGDGPPASVHDGIITVQEDVVFWGGRLGQVIGHDLYVLDGYRVKVPSKIAYGPLARASILSLADPLPAWLQVPSELICPQEVQCTGPQGMAIFIGVWGFSLAHEVSHILLGHGESFSDHVDREVAADRRAYAILDRFAAEFDSSDDDQLRSRLAIRLAPIVFLRFLRERRAADGEKDTPEIVMLTRREAAISAWLTEKERETLGSLDLEKAAMDGTGELLVELDPRTIDVTASDLRIWLDGVPMRAADLGSRPLLVTGGRHSIFVAQRGRLGWASCYVTALDTERVTVGLRTPTETSRAELDALDRKHRWFDILLATTDASLSPRANDVAMLHFEALYQLELGQLLPATWPNLPPRDQRTLTRWRERRMPLERWRR